MNCVWTFSLYSFKKNVTENLFIILYKHWLEYNRKENNLINLKNRNGVEFRKNKIIATLDNFG